MTNGHMVNPTMMIPVLFIFGACVGSFLNVCIYRIPLKKSIVLPGSFCPGCKKSIPFYLNIPIFSYLVLRGRCKFCKTIIHWRYPFVESITGCLAAYTGTRFGLSPEALIWFLFGSVLLLISFIDMDLQIIPDVISIPGTLIFAALAYAILGRDLGSIFFGMITGSGILFAVAMIYYWLKREQGMGGGDIKLMAMIGTLIGVKGALFTIFVGSLLGSIGGVLLIAGSKILNIKQKIPFGPYLSAGALLFVFQGEQLIRWYVNLVGH